MRDGDWKLLRPTIPEAMRVLPRDGEIDRRLKYEPDSITNISRDPVPDRALPDPPPAPLLFHLEEDPYEQHDLAAAQPERVRAMERALDRWFGEVERERRSISD
jgi:hypothetical protein